MRLEVERRHVGIGDLDPGGIGIGIDVAFDVQAVLSRLAPFATHRAA
jgi:hypothetical protein